MPDLERIKPLTQAQLVSAFSAIEQPSSRRLSEEDGQVLSLLVTQMADRYPSQDLEQSLEGYLADFEQLALRYSLRKVRDALAELRITPGQKFFPRPDEVATVIEEQRERKMTPTVNDAQRHLNELKRWKREHAAFMRQLEATNGEEESTGTGTT